MEVNNHDLFDKRQRKPEIFSVKDVNQDITTQRIQTYKLGKAEIRFDAPNMTAIFMSSS